MLRSGTHQGFCNLITDLRAEPGTATASGEKPIPSSTTLGRRGSNGRRPRRNEPPQDPETIVLQQQMRQQTRNYCEAVIREHPEFAPPPAEQPVAEPPPNDAALTALQRAAIEREQRIAALCAELESLCATSEPFLGVKIARAVAMAHGITFKALIGRPRPPHLIKARQHAMWEMRENTTLSLPHIGKILGGRDHSTVIHGIRQHEIRLKGGTT